jgi:MFS family permease
VYALYQHYNYSQGDIGRLFIAGFGSSMLFGTIVGSLGDKYGRKRASVTYCVTYILSCITKHSPQYRVLMLGRILGGIATSLLFSAFESWLVAEHFKRGFEAQWLSLTFSKAIFLGNGLVAILAGLVANTLVSSFSLGPVAPFDAASCLLAVGMGIIIYTWPENYGDPSESKTIVAQFQQAASAITSGKAALFCVSYWLGLLLQDVVYLSIFGFFQCIMRLWMESALGMVGSS